MEKSNTNEEDLDQKKKEVQEGFNGFFSATKDFILNLLNIREDTDKELTIAKIKSGIAVKSHTAWVLIFSIFIASIGLNVSSPAVVIGAMLVSPLMGPILGLGLSIAINDIDTLKRSLINLGVMVGLSITTSFIFFSFPIFQEATPEIIARTAPDIRDVLIALAGGLALIIALSRRSEMTNTIAGIAIATALMPPLCTAGYGLGTWNLDYFLGAMFLFIINAIFIALATFVVVKFLRFPVVKYINQAKRKRIAQIAGFIATLIIGFSVYQFYLLFKANEYKRNAETFISQMQEKTGAGIIDTRIDYDTKNIKIVVLGNNIDNSQKNIWENEMPKFGLLNSSLTIQQDDKSAYLEDEINTIKNSYLKNQNLIATKDEIIQHKEALLIEKDLELQKIYKKQIPFVQISQEAKTIYENLEKLSYANKLETNFSTIDTLIVFEATWKKDLLPNLKQNTQLKNWLQTRLQNNKIELVVK
ncbi:DUF389 domain-containing protein [Wenyingzhuangia sp. 2_MG-2023]|uniref:DUF389 domain-containing protein n=1 Tax=Wenyingzhuangia sp. 2_MG-2023 TaxID=3062639 RepID=UPI0026E347C8|nr:DUF389 domain-containing protein [Wenyingzhuangia sp. 2_MG-2023]MDO6738224.1 DUF389 domain-containing protein [Wenyingzhuangia sp. 2_MG-2023]MDO6802292.1 DUF389 domain-containing protein [Wenyingzhuangia sp. 1_MG-2023]